MRVKVVNYEFDSDGEKVLLAPGGLNIAIDRTCYMSKAAVQKLNLVTAQALGQPLSREFVSEMQNKLEKLLHSLILLDEVSLKPVDGFSTVREDPYFSRYE